ncbi:response regulator [Paenibacillus sp. MBLB4367]|uniref:response regulator n=1 Tax=Paenibacillus sp. MBLB4367 TaxID=3384767 RepID=UPI003908304A
MLSNKIMIVDDEADIVELISLYLRREGFEVVSTNDGRSVMPLIHKEKPDLVILDVLLPGLGGFDVCRTIREVAEIPIIFISCKRDDTDIIEGLSTGGDDYVIKPFSPMQLVARVKAQLRRSRLQDKYTDTEHHTLQFPGLEINLLDHTVKVAGEPVTLSTKEFELLSLLAKTPNRVYKIDHLYETIWGLDGMGDTRTLLVHISNLRKKIEPNAAEPQYILTIRGLGYKFNGNLSNSDGS